MATLTTFTAGTVITAADVNANFEALNTELAAITPTGVGEIAVGDGSTTRLATGTSILTFLHTGTLAAGEVRHLGYKEAVSYIDVAWPVPFACVVQQLRVRANTAPGVGQTLVFTVYDGSSPTAITATISGSNTSAFDIAHTETVTVGALLSVEVVASAGAASSTGVRCTLAVAPR